MLASTNTSADDSVVDDISITVPMSCTLSGTGMNSHNATVNSGTYQADIGTTTLKAICNDNGGFSIYAIGYTGENYGTTTLIGVNTNQTIATGTATSGNTSNWAMKLNTTTSPTPTYPITIQSDTNGSFNNYHIIPATYTKVAERQSGTDVGPSAIGSELTTTYATYISSTQMADTYNGKVKYTLVHPYDDGVPQQPQTTNSGKIGYFPNADGVIDSMGDQSIGDSDTEATLWATNFKRSGYGFAGWSDAFDYKINQGSESNPNAHIYGPNETIEFTAGQYSGDNPGLSLYAVWVKSAGNLQGWNGCSSLTQGNVTALTDTRDNDTYAVAKLADGNCWMIENLRLDVADSYDATKSSTGAYGGVFSGLANPEVANFSSSSTANSRYTSDGTGTLYDLSTNPVTLSDIGTAYPAYRMPRYRNDNTNTDATLNSNVTATNMTGTGQNIYSYGNYYTWASAIADTTSRVGDNALTSLCPTGWRLPRGGGKSNEADNEIWNLVVNELNEGTKPANYDSQNFPYYNTVESGPVDKKVRTWPNNFLYSGRVNGSSVQYRGSRGHYWSSKSVNSQYAYMLVIFDSQVAPGTANSYKFEGKALRCVIGSQ